MKRGIFTVISQKRIAENVFELVLSGDTSAITKPGQFVNILVDGFYLRRPISVCGVDEGNLTLIYKIVGAGTKTLSDYAKGDTLDILTGLGNGYDTQISGGSPLLIGGGAGAPPMYYLCKELTAQGKKPKIILGFNKKSEVFYENEFKALGVETRVCTVDGSYGTKGFVTSEMNGENYTYFYACGPEPMLKAVFCESKTSGQLSFEERMGCGFGACMGCSCKTLTGFKRICKEGPVLKKEEILW